MFGHGRCRWREEELIVKLVHAETAADGARGEAAYLAARVKSLEQAQSEVERAAHENAEAARYPEV